MKKIDGSKLLILIAQKLSSDWNDMCETHITDGVKPIFQVLPAHTCILGKVETALYDNEADDYWKQHTTLDMLRTKFDADVLLNKIVHYGVINNTPRDGKTLPHEEKFVYNESMCIYAETISQLMVDIRDVTLLLEFLKMKQKLELGRFMYNRSIYGECEDRQTYLNIQVIETARVRSQFEEIRKKNYDPLEERHHFYTDITANAKLLEYAGVSVEEILKLEQAVDDLIKDSRTFDIDDKVYAYLNGIALW